MEFDGYSSRGHRFLPEYMLVKHANNENEIQHALSQPYTFFGNGNQCFVYLSQDGEYILKLFKERFHFPHTWLAKLPLATKLLPYLQHKQELGAQKYAKAFAGHVLASTELWEETALLYVHLAPTNSFSDKLEVRDRLGIPHALSLNGIPFLLQKKAVLTKDYFSMLLSEGAMEKMQKAIESLIALIKIRIDHFIHDEDFNPGTNFGFVEDRAVFIDPGRFTKFPLGIDRKQEDENLEKKMRLWAIAQCGTLPSY